MICPITLPMTLQLLSRFAVGQHGRIGNWLEHQYDRVDIETVWNTVTSSS